MLTYEDNEILTRVGPGTPGGAVMREYWLPVLLSSELTPDGPPLRVRLLAEDLIAFRATSGAVGLIQNACPHRGASMFFGRNEEEGLRCVYHGWKFDVHGDCVDMPSEPAESNFKNKVHARAYPCRERNGVIWAYMGSQSPAPPLPELEWNLVPEAQCFVSKRVQRCNWFQALEGGIDSSHSNFVHAPLKPPEVAAGDRAIFRIGSKSLHFETRTTAYGVIVANRRPADEGRVYWRMNHYVMPFYTMFPPTGSRPDTPISGHAWVPIDDETTLVFHWSYNPRQPLTERQVEMALHGNNGLDGFHLSLESRLPATSAPYGAWYPKQRAENDYELDYEAQRTVRFSGVPGGWNQDAAVQESMGAVTDRRREHLGTSDTGIIAARRYFLAVAKALAAGSPPPGINQPSLFRIRPAEAVVAADADWFQELQDGAMQPQLAPLPVSVAR